jgi:hypothetical protein
VTIAAEVGIAESLDQRPHRLHAARMAFRRWRRTRPFWAGVWAMLGGALIAYVPATAFKLLLVANSSLIIGILVGALVGVFGLMLWFARPLRVLLGVLIVLLSLVSFFTSDFGGLLLGMLMGLIGGSLAIAWVPTKVTWRQRRRARKRAVAGEEPSPAAASELPAETATTITQTVDADAVVATSPDLAAEILAQGDAENSADVTRHRPWLVRTKRHGSHSRSG